MLSEQFDTIQFHIKKRDILLYKASRGSRQYVLKCTASGDPALRQAFHDEYRVMSRISHPRIPVYHQLLDGIRLPDREDLPYLILCMQDMTADPGQSSTMETSGLKPSTIIDTRGLDMGAILSIMDQTARILYDLLKEGVLYTDLNPSNLVIHRLEGSLMVYLVDFTCCYYFLENPHPAYRLRFSYNLSPELKGQQMLIQELSFLLQELLEASSEAAAVPGRVYQLLETGMHPGEGLTLSDYRQMIADLIGLIS
ncbi:MAG: hypothetical protein IJ137_11075 [Eubacterium sp.]|nr:hypothetical protein [Eubacterium sp.]